MRYFLKLNAASALYGGAAFVFVEFILRGGWILDKTGMSVKVLDGIFWAVSIVGLAGMTILCSRTTERFLEGKKKALFTTVLWFVYWVLFTFCLAYFSPNPNDEDNYGAAFAILFFLLIYPLFLFLVTLMSVKD